MKRAARGFTLIEVLVAVAIVGILTAVALPAYRDYVIRARLTEAYSALGGIQLSLEQYWSNNRQYTGFVVPAPTPNFSYVLSSASTSAYLVTATGAGPVTGFIFTVDQSGARATTKVPTGWATNANCWVDRKGGSCSQ